MENIKSVYKNKIVLALILVVLFFWKSEMIIQFIGEIYQVLNPFIIAGVMAFIINVPMVKLENRLFKNIKNQKILRLKRMISLVVTLVLFVLVISVAIFIVLPQLADTMEVLSAQVLIFIPKAEAYILDVFNNNPEIEAWIKSITEFDFMNSILSFLQVGITGVLDTTIGVASQFVSVMTASLIAFVLAIYVLLQKEKLGLQCKKVIYAFSSREKAKEILRILSLTRKTFTDFVSGQCVEAVILGLMFVVILPLFSIPFSLLIGIIIGFTSIIPVLGAFIGAFVGAFIILIEDPMKAVYFIIIFLVIQQIEGNLIYPKVVGGSIGLPAIWVLSAVSIGSSLFGVAGILFFIPLTSVVYTLFKEVVNKKIKDKNIQMSDL